LYDKYFGSYLLRKNILTAEDLKKILDHMHKTRIKLGTLAIQQGLLTGSQVEEIIEAQKNSDMYFGEIAIAKGFITLEKAGELLRLQSRESKLQLGQAAVDLGYFNYEELDRELRNFEIDSGLNYDQLDILEEGKNDEIIREFIDFNCEEFSAILYDYTSLMLRNITRFLDQQPWLDLEKQELKNNCICAYQYLNYKRKIFTAILTGPDSFMKIAEQYAGMPVEDNPELAESSLAEFLNLHNGLFSVNMSNQGKIIKLTPPEISRNQQPDILDEAHLVGINTSIGRIILALALR